MKTLAMIIGYLAIVAGVLVVGWKQPLKYLFMSEQEIFELEHPAPPVKPAPTPRGTWMWDPARHSSLDQSKKG